MTDEAIVFNEFKQYKEKILAELNFEAIVDRGPISLWRVVEQKKCWRLSTAEEKIES